MSPEAAKRASVNMTDQCFASGTNFVVGVAVARLAGARGLGAFALAYACWILLTQLHRSLVTDPMAISGDMRETQAVESIRQGFGAEVALGLAATAMFAFVGGLLIVAGQRAFGVAILAVAPWVTFLDLQDYWRWIGFMQGKPGKALVNDMVFAVAQLAAFVIVYATGVHSIFAVVSAWGAGAVAGALYGLQQFSVRPSLRGGLSLLRSRWHMSKWLAGTSVTNWGAGQAYLIVAGGFLGPAALGGLKASQALVTGPSSVVIHAGGSFGLPEASRALADHGLRAMRRVTRWISTAGALTTGVFGAVVFFFGSTLLRVIYGAQFARYEPAAKLMAVAMLVSAFGLGPILTLKVTKRTRSLFNVQVITLAVSVPSVAALAVLHGVTGAAAAVLLSDLAALIALLLYQRAARRSLRDPVLVVGAAGAPTLGEVSAS
jgi:O-antigen/teichoic acid export membrane protein